MSIWSTPAYDGLRVMGRPIESVGGAHAGSSPTTGARQAMRPRGTTASDSRPRQGGSPIFWQAGD